MGKESRTGSGTPPCARKWYTEPLTKGVPELIPDPFPKSLRTSLSSVWFAGTTASRKNDLNNYFWASIGNFLPELIVRYYFRMHILELQDFGFCMGPGRFQYCCCKSYLRKAWFKTPGEAEAKMRLKRGQKEVQMLGVARLQNEMARKVCIMPFQNEAAYRKLKI